LRFVEYLDNRRASKLNTLILKINLQAIPELVNSILTKPAFKDLTINQNLNTLPLFSEDSIIDTSSLTCNNFFNFPNESNIDTLEDSYEHLKYINYIYHLNYKNLLQLKTSPAYPLSYTQIIDNFRADYEDNSWYLDLVENNIYTTANSENETGLRVTNNMKLRSSARSAIVTYNAIQKVFKSRFDEGRSHARLQDFSNSYTSHPFITEKKSPYENMLAKNIDNFFNINMYKSSPITYFNSNIAI
jgi:hypothetical protein